jgi:M6 family metalloprotease-like protein
MSSAWAHSVPENRAASSAPAAACRLSPGGAEGRIDPAYTIAPRGTVRALMLFVDFPDAAPAGHFSKYQQLLVPQGTAFMNEVSYGQLTLKVTALHRWIDMPHASTDYGWQRGLTHETHKAYIADAVAAAGKISGHYDLLYIVPTQTAAGISFSPTYLSASGDGFKVGGREIRDVVTFGQDIWNPGWGYRVLVHETGHTFGLPDLYAFDAKNDQHRYVGGWDVMGNVAGPSPEYLAWHRMLFGWLKPKQVLCLGTTHGHNVTLTPIEKRGGLKAVILRTGKNAVTVAEYRAGTGSDRAQCSRGLLVYRVDNNRATGHGPVVVADARPHSNPQPGCHQLDDGAFNLTARKYRDGAGNSLTVRALSHTSLTVHVVFPHGPVRH